MRSSLLFRRVFTLLAAALILWIVLTAILYAFIARPVFTDMKAREIEPLAHILADRAGLTDDSLDNFVHETVGYANEMFGNWMFVISRNTPFIFHTPLPDSMTSIRQEIVSTVSDADRQLAKADSVVFTKSFKGQSSAFLFVVVPIGAPLDGPGSLAIVQPMSEINAGILSLNLALLTSSLAILLIMIVPIMLATMRILKPLHSVRRVAMAMSAGDFSQRADESASGEFHDLAVAVNHLAGELSSLIAQLTFERNRLRQILNSIAEGIIAVNKEGLVTECNLKVWDVFGVTTDMSRPLSPDVFLQTTKLNEFFHDAMTMKQDVAHVISKDHRQIYCLITPLINERGTQDGAVGLFRDITESERLEQTRRDYIANVSHELRTPLTAMRALLEPLAEDMVRKEDDKKRYYAILLRETMRLSRLINDMLELSRLQATDDSAELCIVQLEPIISNVLQRFQPVAEEHDVSLSAPGSMSDCPNVWSDPDWLEQIIAIFVDNAIKFTPKGGDITLGIKADSDTAAISVRDSGVGIAPEDIDHVFDRFFKADRAHNEPGTGLGLSIASEIARQIHATLSVKSEPGEGSIFTVHVRTADAAIKDMPVTIDAEESP